MKRSIVRVLFPIGLLALPSTLAQAAPPHSAKPPPTSPAKPPTAAPKAPATAPVAAPGAQAPKAPAPAPPNAPSGPSTGATAGVTEKSVNLQVTRLSVTRQCELSAVVESVGAPIPPSVTSAAVQFLGRGGTLGAWPIDLDELRKGNKVTIIANNIKLSNKETIRAAIQEPRMALTSFSKELSCLPDLKITQVVRRSVMFHEGPPICDLILNIANVGTAPIPDKYKDSVIIRRVLDGRPVQSQKFADDNARTRGIPQTPLAEPGGIGDVWDVRRVPVFSNYRYEIDAPFAELSKDNNVTVGNVDAECNRPELATRKYDFSILDVELNDKCEVMMTFRNEGPSHLINHVVPIVFSNEEGLTSEVEFNGWVTPGQRARVAGPVYTGTKKIDWTVKFKDPIPFEENKANNTKTVKLACKKKK